MHPSSGAQLQRTAIGCVSVENSGFSIKWCGGLFCMDVCARFSKPRVIFMCWCVCDTQTNTHTKQTYTPLDTKISVFHRYTAYGCTLQLCSWWWVQITPETCRAKDERNKEYSVHLVGPQLNIYGNVNSKSINLALSLQLTAFPHSGSLVEFTSVCTSK
jgi:hypothetical protein